MQPDLRFGNISGAPAAHSCCYFCWVISGISLRCYRIIVLILFEFSLLVSSRDLVGNWPFEAILNLIFSSLNISRKTEPQHTTKETINPCNFSDHKGSSKIRSANIKTRKRELRTITLNLIAIAENGL